MTWSDRLNLTLGIVLAVVPLAANVFLLLRRKRYLLATGSRYRVALAGLVLALIASLPAPLFFLALELPWKVKGAWLPLGAAWLMPASLVAGLLAMVLLAFGKGRARWIGIATSFVSTTLLYLILLGLSD